jgi:hypothetical protein
MFPSTIGCRTSRPPPYDFGRVWYAGRPIANRGFDSDPELVYEACWKQWESPPIHFQDPNTPFPSRSINDNFSVSDGDGFLVPNTFSLLPGQTTNVSGMDGTAFAFCQVDQFTPDLVEYLSGNQGFGLSGYSDSLGGRSMHRKKPHGY